MTKEQRKTRNSAAYSVYEQHRVALGYTDYHISKALSIPRSTLSDWKYGRCMPNAYTLMKLCEYLGMSMREVLVDG